MRKWSSAQEALDVIMDEDWIWPRNARCKYIELRIDTRDGHCIIKDLEGKIITMKELQRQAGVKAKNPIVSEQDEKNHIKDTPLTTRGICRNYGCEGYESGLFQNGKCIRCGADQ